MADDRPIEEVLNTIGDKSIRTILAALSREPQSAQELSTNLDFSQATVYRRLETLEEHKLIKDRTIVADDGNHYKLYECNFNSTVISLDDDEYDVRIFREDNLPDRFTQLWDDMRLE